MKVEIEIRDGMIIAINPDGTETVIDTYERLVRLAYGEFNEG